MTLFPSWQVLEPSFRQAFPNTNRWFLTCINQPQFRAILGEVKLCEKMAQFDGKAEEAEDCAARVWGWLLDLSPGFAVNLLGYVSPQSVGYHAVTDIL